MNFRNILIGAVSVAAVAAMAGSAAAATSADVAVAAKIIQPLSITGGTTAMNFGTIIKQGSGDQTVIVDTTGSHTGGTATTIASSSFHQAAYTIGGENAQAFTIGLAATGLGTGVSLDTFTLSGCGTALATATISTGSSCTANIGGTLHVDPTSVITGTVNGTLTATVTYN